MTDEQKAILDSIPREDLVQMLKENVWYYDSGFKNTNTFPTGEEMIVGLWQRHYKKGE